VSGTSPRAGRALSPWAPTAAQNLADPHETPLSPSSSGLVLVAAAFAGPAADPNVSASTTPSVVSIASAVLMIFRILASRTLKETEIDHHEHQDDPDVHCQPQPEPTAEEQDVRADHDGHHREHVKHNGCLSSHCFLLFCATGPEERPHP
jgi:hypothetical protein